jgi:diguanylate cyclase (GGDEF)-like protein
MPVPDERFASALFRMLEARLSLRVAGVYARESGGYRLVAGTEALRAVDADAAVALLGEACAAPAGALRQIDAAALGLAGGFAAVAPVAGPVVGVLLAADARPRRLRGSMAAALADAAALAAPLLAPGRRAPERNVQADPAGLAPGLGGAVRPRMLRMVEAALKPHRKAAPAVMMLDLDRFRAVNEALGTAAGDALLAVTGARLEQALDPGDRLLRLEGDRFVIVARRGPAELRALARRLLMAVSQPLVLDGRTVVMHASIGIVAALHGGLPAHVLLARADTALRRAKAEGRNRFVLHEPGHDAAVLDRSRLELDLANALGTGEMHLVYQPYVDLGDARTDGVEALLRWRHPTRGELQPAAFIPVAEATGLILPLGKWALRTALEQAARWPTRLGLAVNISPLQFHQPGFLAQVDAALDATGFPAERLELEITETVLMRDNPETIAQLRALIDRGIRIALDDFGTGYSALAYLARLPHHRIKLDKAFVQDLANPATAALIRAIIALARARGVAVTAEGVERAEQLAEVRRMGFTHAQGFATGAPVTDPMAAAAVRSAPEPAA